MLTGTKLERPRVVGARHGHGADEVQARPQFVVAERAGPGPIGGGDGDLTQVQQASIAVDPHGLVHRRRDGQREHH